jgi:hypothetical protein
MNHLTAHAYEQDDGTLVIYRCPVCGSTGPIASACLHEAPLADHRNGWVERESVRVPKVGEELLSADDLESLRRLARTLEDEADTAPNDWLEEWADNDAALLRRIADHFDQQVGEEPRYTLEQVKEGLMREVARLSASPPAVLLSDGGYQRGRGDERGTWLAALDHFTQQPVGVGAKDCWRCEGSGEAWSIAGERRTTTGPCPDCEGTGKASADSDGNQQPLGGDADAESRRDDHRSATSAVVAGGGSGQGAGSGSALIRCKRCGMVAGEAGEVDPFGPWRKSGCIGGGEHGPTETTISIQHPSGGQEADTGGNDSSTTGGQEGGVEEGADRG